MAEPPVHGVNMAKQSENNTPDGLFEIDAAN
jgi:hypothetical protein